MSGNGGNGGNGGNPHNLRDLPGTYEKSGLASFDMSTIKIFEKEFIRWAQIRLIKNSQVSIY